MKNYVKKNVFSLGYYKKSAMIKSYTGCAVVIKLLILRKLIREDSNILYISIFVCIYFSHNKITIESE